VSVGVCAYDGTPLDSATAIAVASTINPSLRAEPAADAKGPDALVGMRIDKYVVDAVIGRGGMGAVYRVTHAELGNKFALKVMDERIVGSSEGHARFLREARAAARIDHPNVIRVLDHARDPEIGSYLVMELLSGTSLDRVIAKEGQLAQERAIDIALQIGDALGAAHEQGIVHRDLKPANVFLTQQRGAEVVKVMDFGVAKLVADGSTLLTRPGSVIGTPLYMSPEQWDNDTIDARSDVYSFGVVLYEMLTGRVPFRGNGITEVAKNLATMEPPPPRSLRPELSSAIEAVVLRCLSKKKEDRYPSMRDVSDALVHARQSRSGHDSLVTARSHARARSRRTRTVLVAAALAGVALAGVGLGMARRTERARAQPTTQAPTEAIAAPAGQLDAASLAAVAQPSATATATATAVADAAPPPSDVVTTPSAARRSSIAPSNATPVAPGRKPAAKASKPRDELFGE
jgi:hypothetical protein